MAAESKPENGMQIFLKVKNLCVVLSCTCGLHIVIVHVFVFLYCT